MLSKDQKLNEDVFSKDVESVATRNGFGEGLVLSGEKDERVVTLCADLTDSTRIKAFKEKFPDRYVQVGVAEQLLASAAAGMAAYGKIPFIASYAAFSPGRNWEQIRTTAALNDMPVKVVGCHAGISVGPDGATHQALEDIATMRVIPNMIVVYPCDAIEAKKATTAVSENGKPSYLRLAREKTPVVTTEDSPFKIGRAEVLWDTTEGKGKDKLEPVVSIIAAGPLVYEALVAAKKLAKSKIGSIVVNSHTIKPLDEQTIVRSAKTTGCVVTVEEAQVAGGLGGAVSEVLAKKFPVPMEFIGMQDEFGESGAPNKLLKKHKMKSDDIVAACKRVIKRRSD